MFVPIDAIPLLQLEVAPVMGAGAVDGVLSGGLPVGAGGGWQQRGPNFLRYHVTQVELRLVRVNGAPPPPGMTPTTEGPRPYTWRHGDQQGGGDGLPVDLAILDWKPTNADKAMLEGPGLDAVVDGIWGRVCDPVAAPAAVLWTFRRSPLGPSESGWRLAGEAWPDPPGARRSRPVVTGLRVRELWRTATVLDGLLPHGPAQVVGIGAACPKTPPVGPRPLPPSDPVADPGDRLRADLAPAPSRRPDPALSIEGLAVPVAPADGAATTHGVEGGGFRPALRVAERCVAKVLEAPYEQLAGALLGEVGAGPVAELLQQVDDTRFDDLRDVVRLTGGPFVSLTLLVYARAKMVEQGLLQVRGIAAGGAEIAGVNATFLPVQDDSVLPPSWLDHAGPWWDDVALARGYATETGVNKELPEFLVKVDLPQPALHVDLGVRPLAVAVDGFGMDAPSYLVAVVEGLSLGEVERGGEDATQTEGDAGGVEGAVGGQAHALLRPGAQYEVVVHYDAEIGAKRVDPEPDEDPDEIVVLRSVTGETDRRSFFTDAQAPRSLEPWALAQFPSQAERFHFHDDPVVVVFATDDVLELFATHGRKLRAVARAASFRGSQGTPDAPLTHLQLDGFYATIGKLVLSPWEATVRRRLGDLPCLDADPDADGHGRAVLPLKLDPLTDYVLDLEALLPNGTPAPVAPLPGEVGTRPLYRRSFTTSRYASREALATAVHTALIRSRVVADRAPLDALADVVTDEAMDAALADAGLDPVGPPGEPVVWKLWTADTPSVAVAVLLHTPEPLWRRRLEPRAEWDADGEHIVRWRLEPTEWLSVDELVPDSATPVSEGGTFVQRGTGVMTTLALTLPELRRASLRRPAPEPAGPPPAGAQVTRLVHDVGGTRTLAFLAPSAGGHTVTLGLRRVLNPLLDADVSDTPLALAEVQLSDPPWGSP